MLSCNSRNDRSFANQTEGAVPVCWSSNRIASTVVVSVSNLLSLVCSELYYAVNLQMSD